MTERRFDYYFAYGSNLNKRQMHRRCPDAQRVARYSLDGWRLTFREVANVIRAPDRCTNGALYTITDADVTGLDIAEGYRPGRIENNSYIRTYLTVTVNGETAVIMFYVMVTPRYGEPKPDYVECIRTGFDEWAIDRASFDEALEYSRTMGYGNGL